MQNKTFQKATRLLCSPVSLGAMLLLLLNDHVLRVYAPSWWTGKLGDFAWLFFFPFALAAFLALLIPARVPHQEKIVKWLAFGLIGGIFALAKTIPFFHALTVHLVETILGFPVGWVRDPSDLIALVSLMVGWLFWERQTATAGSRSQAGWAALSIAALLTIANSPAVDLGINKLCKQANTIYAQSQYAVFSSEDGGLSWSTSEQINGYGSLSTQGCSNPHSDPTNPNILYRSTPGVVIERSDDAGQTWHSDFNLSPVSQAEQASYGRRTGYPTFRAGPLDMLADPVSGNVIFAMGHEGLLVRKPNAEWVWVPVGYYQRMGLESALSLLVGEMMLALGFGLLSIVTLMQQFRAKPLEINSLLISFGLALIALFSFLFLVGPMALVIEVGFVLLFLLTLLPWFRNRWPKMSILIPGWILWGLNILVKPALITQPYSEVRINADLVLIVLGCIILVAIGIGEAIEIGSRNRNGLLRIAVVGLGGVILFILPYILWMRNILPEYNYAMYSAFALSAVTVIVGVIITRRIVIPSKATTLEK